VGEAAVVAVLLLLLLQLRRGRDWIGECLEFGVGDCGCGVGLWQIGQVLVASKWSFEKWALIC
jgi:hypothetical protein